VEVILRRVNVAEPTLVNVLAIVIVIAAAIAAPAIAAPDFDVSNVCGRS
jgi:hypothetical protein